MAREVNVYTSNWQATGLKVQVPQYTVDVTLKWIDDAGVAHTRSETLKFPNFLQNVGAEDLKIWLTDLMIREAQQRLVN